MLSPNVASSDPDIVAKSRFAELANVSAPRVSQWIAGGKISGEALVGEGRGARIRISVACAQLKRTLDISQRLGNGITTRLDQAPPPVPTAEGDPAASLPPSPPAAPRQSSAGDPIEEQLKREKLEQLQRQNRKAAREEAEKIGRLTDSDLMRQQTGRAVAQTVMLFDGSTPEIGNALAAAFNLPARDVVHFLRGEIRRIRAAAVKTLRRTLEDIPLLIDVDVGEETGTEEELPDKPAAAVEP